VCARARGCIQLHELAYEKGHLEREIAFERRFGSAHEQIVLPSATDMQAKSASSTAAAAGEHQLMLELLAYELSLREQLVGEESKMAERRKTLQAQVARKRQFLEDDLPGQLSDLCAAAKPLASFRPQTSEEQGDSVALGQAGGDADGLPPALFTLVSQFQAYRDEFATAAGAVMTVRILGDASAITKPDPTEPPSSKQRRTDPPTRASALEPFPLSLEVTHSNGSKHGTLQLKFWYLPELALLVADGEWQPAKGASKKGKGKAKKLSGPELLAQVCDEDHGLELPSPASVHVLSSGTWPVAEAEAAGSTGQARPYRWLQWLGGLYQSAPCTAAASAVVDRDRDTGRDGGYGQDGSSWSVYSTLERILQSTAVE
jgi:hypothetical protein